MKRFLPFLSALLFFLSAPARADPLGKAHFDEGVTAYDARQYAKALDEFRMAYDILKVYVIRRNIGLTLRALGHNADAIQALQIYLHDGGVGIDPTTVEATEKAISEMMPLVGTIVLKVTCPTTSTEPAWRLTINDDAVDDALARQAIPLDPGTYSFHVRAGGFHEVTTQVQVVAGQRNTAVPMELKPQVPAAQIPAAQVPSNGSLRVLTNVPSARILVDGGSLRLGQWAGSLTVGEHTVNVTAPGLGSRSFKVQIVEKRPFTLRLTIPPTGHTM